MVPAVAGRGLGGGVAVAEVEKRRGLAGRLVAYQRERFPLAAYVPLVLVFTFSAAAYSRLLRQEPGFISWQVYGVGALTALVFFFLLRVLDEHKDAATDRKYRPDLPVPRGLVSLAELRGIGVSLLVAVVALNALLAPRLLWACLAVGVWAGLMTREFFIPEWLRARPTAYLLSHMLIMPMIDAYTTGLDWLASGVPARHGLWCFLVVTFLNGVVLEVGRKIRAPEDEREGVDTYTRAWGLRGAPLTWLAVLFSTAATAVMAARLTGAGVGTAAVIVLLCVLTGLAAVMFLRSPTGKAARRIDLAGGLWTLAMYLVLGALPFLARGF